jgi:hypothetical protein
MTTKVPWMMMFLAGPLLACAQLAAVVPMAGHSSGASASNSGGGSSSSSSRPGRAKSGLGPDPDPAPGVSAADCHGLDSVGYMQNLRDDRAKQVTGLTCSYLYYSDALPEDNVFVLLHQRMDDATPDPLGEAMIVVGCVGARASERRSRHPNDTVCLAHVAPVAVGQVAWYASHIDPAAVQAELAKLQLNDNVRRAFMGRLASSKELVLREAAKLDERRRDMYMDIPARVHEARKQRRASPLYRRYLTLRPQLEAASVSADALAQARAVRDDYVKQCKQRPGWDIEGCWQGDLARPLTELIIKGALARKNVALALAEAELLEDRDDNSSQASEIWFEQHRALLREQQRWQAVQSARDSGKTEQQILAELGPPAPIEVDVDIAWPAARRPKSTIRLDIHRTLPADTRDMYESGVIKSVGGGATAAVVFGEMKFEADQYKCHNTNKIESIERDGTVHWKQQCNYTGTDIRKYVTPKPIKLVDGEAEGLKPGEKISTVIDPKTRAGYLVKAEARKGNHDAGVIKVRGLMY